VPAGRGGPSLRPSRTAALTFARSRRSSGQRHHGVVDIGIDRHRAVLRLLRPFSPQIEGVFVVHDRIKLVPAIIPIGSHGQHSDAIVVPIRLWKISEAVRQGSKPIGYMAADTPIALVVNNAARATPCACAPLTGADLGRHTFMRFQCICGRPIRKEAERT